MAEGRDTVRILLVGEPGVGKTTLILSLVSEEFSPKVPAQAEEITIPADVTPERVPTQIVDYSSQTQTHEQLCAEIKRADVICLVHSLDNDASFKQISAYWLPLIRHIGSNTDSHTPVVLVGNKLDLRGESRLDQMLPIMSEFSEVETCIECSAKTMLNLSETFWFAQKAVLYPTAPLYKAETKELTPGCIRALTRIFRICDTDNDGYLSDRELEAFQTRCFGVPLTLNSLQDVKTLVRQSCPGGLTLNGLTQKGFLFLHLMFIQKGRHETTWTVLRQFGYDNQMRLSSEFVYPTITIPTGCSAEISTLGLQFLNNLFNKYDLDRDGCLSTTELCELMATCPEEQVARVTDLGVCVATNYSGWVTRQGFLAFWILTVYLEPSRLLEYFAYLGFTYFAAGSYWSSPVSSGSDQMHEGVTLATRKLSHQDNTVIHSATATSGSQSLVSHRSEYGPSAETLNSASEALLRGIIITADKRLEAIRRYTQRNVFYCRVYGAKKVGKTCLLQGLLGRSIRFSAGFGIGGVSGQTTSWVAASGVPVYGQSRTLLMQEISETAGQHMSANEALSADVACLVYDVSNPESFRYVANLFLNFYRGTRIPCLFVAAKSDQPHVIQDYQIEPAEMAAKYNLPPPEPFSSFHIQRRSRQGQHNEEHLESGSNVLESRLQRPRRAGSAEPSLSPFHGGFDKSNHLHDNVADRNGLNPKRSQKGDDGNNDDDDDGENQNAASRGRRHSRSDLTSRVSRADASSTDYEFSSVYILLCTMANYPHHRGLELSNTDHAWKWTLAATILAGFGFFAFRMAKTHL